MTKKILVLEGQAYSLEKEGKLDEAKRLYWQVINDGFTGSFPYERLRIIYAKEKDWEEAIKVCRIYVELNAFYGGYNVKTKRMQEWIRKYEAKLGIKVETQTAETVLKAAVKSASVSARDRCDVTVPEYKASLVFPHWARGEIVLNSIAVPEFQQYYPAEFHMNRSQKNFYEIWKRNWNQGNPIDVKGNISYLFAYVYGVIGSAKNQPKETLMELRLLQKVYKTEPRFVQYLTRWIFDVYLMQSEYLNAMAYLESRSGVEKINRVDNIILSLKYKLGLPLAGLDVVSMYHTTPRKLVLNNLEFIIDWLDGLIEDFEERNNVDLLALVTEQFAFQESSETYLFNGTPFCHKIQLTIFNYSALGDFQIVLDQWFKDAENILRKERGLPKIGEGWISEAMLYNVVSKIFTEMGYDVIHHSYPAFLQRQELDIHIPALKLGIEYMGKQHYEPIEFFGGQLGLEKTKARDEKKRRTCRKHGLEVIDFRYDEPIEEIYVRSKLKKFISIAASG